MARLSETGRLAITGLHNQIALRTAGVVAAKWEAAADETILLVMREDPEDEPVAVRAFRPRLGRQWQMEDAHAEPLLSHDGKYVAMKFAVPNHAVAILPVGKVVQSFAARVNLGSPAQSVAWSEQSPLLTVVAAERTMQWSPGARQFRKTNS